MRIILIIIIIIILLSISILIIIIIMIMIPRRVRAGLAATECDYRPIHKLRIVIQEGLTQADS